MITLRFVSHPGIFNWACQIAQYGFWATHVEAVMPEGTLLGAMSDGVKARPADYDNLGGTAAFIRQEFVNVHVTPEQEDIFYEYLRSQVGRPYDFWAIYAFFWPSRDWQESDRWDCAELIGTSFSMCGVLPREIAMGYSRLTVLGLDQIISMRTEAG